MDERIVHLKQKGVSDGGKPSRRIKHVATKTVKKGRSPNIRIRSKAALEKVVEESRRKGSRDKNSG